MKKRISKIMRNLFIPNKSNDYCPTFFETRNALVFLTLVVVIFVCSIDISNILKLSDGKYQASAVLPGMLVDLTNKERINSSINILQESEILDQAATLKAQDMATKGYFAHISPEGRTPWSWLKDVNYDYEFAGENLAVNFSDSKYVTNAWMNSPTHKANIIKPEYTEIGTGVATGTFDGRNSIFVAQVYAKPFRPTVNSEQILANAMAAFAGIDSTKEFFSYVLYNNSDLTNVILFGLLIFVLIALSIVIFVKSKIQYWKLIRNGLIICFFIIILILVNNFIQKSSFYNINYSSIEYSLDENGQNIVSSESNSSI